MTTIPGQEQVTYRIDAQDLIAAVNTAWAPFACANDAPQLADVLGQSLWDHVADDTTRQVYRRLMVRVRAGHYVTFPYRCDAPTMRRFMRMTMDSAPDRGVVFTSVTERTETREALPLADGAHTGRKRAVRTCSWCSRLHVRDTWQEVELAVEGLGLFTGDSAPALTHGMCEDCYARVMEAGGL